MITTPQEQSKLNEIMQSGGRNLDQRQAFLPDISELIISHIGDNLLSIEKSGIWPNVIEVGPDLLRSFCSACLENRGHASKKRNLIIMTFSDGTKSICRPARWLVDQLRDILPYWRVAMRKPVTLWFILTTAHRIQITLVILFVFMVFLVPTVVDFVSGLIFPPETTKKVFGLINTQRTNPWKNVLYTIIMISSWAATILTVLLKFWFHIPVGLTRANASARKLLVVAEGQSDALHRKTLYRRALAIATDPDLESELESLVEHATAPTRVDMNTGSTETLREAPNTDTVHDASKPVVKRVDSLSTDGLSDRYELRERIGIGAMGVVYSAWDKVLDRKVAIKRLSMSLCGDDEYTLRFRREAKALARLNHPNVVQVYDLSEEGNRLWMVVEYVDGGNLASYLKDSGRLSICQAVSMIIPIAEGLGLAHSHGIIHRDLKPANILLTSARIPKITDFGIAKLSQSCELTQIGAVLGSPPYMSPEQCSGGSVDSRTDIYALGITLYELLTGDKPFDGETSSVLARQIVEQPAPLSEHLESIPSELENLILQMLAKNPDERPSEMAKVAELLSSFKDEVLSLERSHRGQNTS